MSAEKSNLPRKKVTPIGNAWVMTESKSHPGYIYYFNTVTREAVWNLSDSQIEKARLAPESSEFPSESNLGCTEPKDKPPSLKAGNKFHDSINNQRGPIFMTDVSQAQHGNSMNSDQHQSEAVFPRTSEVNETQNQSGAAFSAMPMSDISAFDISTLNRHINAYNIIGTPNVYNSGVWPIPHSQQYIITPTIPFVNSGQAALNSGFDQVLQNNQTPSSRFTNNMENRRLRFSNSRNSFGRGSNYRRNISPLPVSDLRQQLSLRKKNKTLYVKDTEESSSFIPDINKSSADVTSYFDEIIELKSNSPGTRKNGTNSKIDLTPLRSMTVSDNNEKWYIVVDLNVLLEEFNLLIEIIDSDELCILFVPENVVSELKDYIASSNNIPARRIFHSLTERIESGRVSLGQETYQDFGNSITNPILKSCFSLLEENVNVILLTNDSELLKYKKFIKVNIFTVDEVRTLLNNQINEYQPNLSTPLSPKDLITITIPGNKIPATATFTHTASDIEKSTQAEPVIEETTNMKNVSELRVDREANYQANHPIKPLEHEIHAEIQTDTNNVLKYRKSEKVIDKVLETNSINSSNKTVTTHESLSNVPAMNVSNMPLKRRGIKLKRSIPDNQVSLAMRKKTFRWRRNRHSNIQGSWTPPNSDKLPQDSQDISKVRSVNTVSNETEIRVDEELNETEIRVDEELDDISNNVHETDNSSNLNEVVQSRDSSIICLSTNKINITIEESSTSGVISNTETNVDSECMKYNDNHKSKAIMHIDSESMEESLKTKCEEWVSRFVQIMEEVLAEVLHKEPAFTNMTLPPPWTLHEATQCIGKYSNVPALKYTADKLSRDLFDVSDITGKISLDITPSQYMEIYNDGVLLLQELKAITTHLEDVEIAELSLLRLINDIKDPHNDLNDSEIDLLDKTGISDTLNESINSNCSNRKKKKRLDDQTEEEYNLTSPPKSPIEEPTKQLTPVKIIRNLIDKSSFLANLKLQKVSRISSKTETNELCDEIKGSVTISDCDSNVESEKSFKALNVVRNFTKSAELEQQLRNKFDLDAYDECDLDNEEDHESNSEASECDQYDMSYDDAGQSGPNVTQFVDRKSSVTAITDNVVTSSPKLVDPSLANKSKSNNIFKVMVHIFLQEIRNAISEVKVLCDKCYAELKKPQLSKLQRNDLKNQIENARPHIFRLCLSLQSMLHRDPDAPSDNIETALKKAGIDMSNIDENLLLQYWDTIAKCKKHADVFLFSIQEIKCALQNLSDE